MGIQLTKQQVEQYFELGYVVVEGVLSPEKLARLRKETESIIADAASVSAHNDVYDLEEGRF